MRNLSVAEQKFSRLSIYHFLKNINSEIIILKFMNSRSFYAKNKIKIIKICWNISIFYCRSDMIVKNNKTMNSVVDERNELFPASINVSIP